MRNQSQNRLRKFDTLHSGKNQTGQKWLPSIGGALLKGLLRQYVMLQERKM